MSDAWTNLARNHGPKSVVSLSITDAELEAETNRQATVVFPMIDGLLAGEVTALDFGCGAGRFTTMLAAATGCLTTGYDPCAEFSANWRDGPNVDFTSDRAALIDGSYELVLVWGVLGDRHLDPEATADNIVKMLTSRGLLVLVDHMTVDYKDRWWIVRPAGFYMDLFRRRGVALRSLGNDRQLDVPNTILAGRKG